VEKCSARSDSLVHTDADWIIVEEPLELQVSGEPFMVTMRTPGHDYELAAGLLFAEGLVSSTADLQSIRHCTRGPPPHENVLDILPTPGGPLDRDIPARQLLSTSACGLCGRTKIADLEQRLAPLQGRTRWPRQRVQAMTDDLRSHQTNFEKTGGGHAAGVYGTAGSVHHVREDVGRHNAVDKVVGRLFLDAALPATGRALVVSGRISFEIVQKAVTAGFELLIGVSAPTSLAIETAHQLNLSLVGFSRGESFNVYAGGERLVSSF
jgi:FdhD protein